MLQKQSPATHFSWVATWALNLQPQHLRTGAWRVRSSRSSLATNQVQGQPRHVSLSFQKQSTFPNQTPTCKPLLGIFSISTSEIALEPIPSSWSHPWSLTAQTTASNPPLSTTTVSALRLILARLTFAECQSLGPVSSGSKRKESVCHPWDP